MVLVGESQQQAVVALRGLYVPLFAQKCEGGIGKIGAPFIDDSLHDAERKRRMDAISSPVSNAPKPNKGIHVSLLFVLLVYLSTF